MTEIEENEKSDIKLYQTLKDEAYYLYESIKEIKDVKLCDIRKILDIYDIDPNINNFFLDKCLDYCSDKLKSKEESNLYSIIPLNEDCEDNDKELFIEDFCENYLYYINSLSLNQKKKLNKKIQKKENLYSYMKKYINNDSNLKKINQIFNIIIQNDLDQKEIKKLFETKYFINISEIHIPLIYGNKELRYAIIINDIKTFLFENELYYNEEYSINRYKKIENYNKDIIVKLKPGDNTFKNNQDNKKNIIDKKMDNTKKKFSFENKYEFLINFISHIFKENKIKPKNLLFGLKIDYKDDLDSFSPGYTLNDDIDFLYYNLLHFDLIIYCYLYYTKSTSEKVEQIAKLFERKIIKNKKLKEYKNIIKDNFSVVENSSNDLSKDKIRITNKSDKNEFFEFNPNEYILENIDGSSDYQLFKKQFEDEKNFSLYKYYRENKLFDKEILNREYKNNIDKMLVSDIIQEVFQSFSNYKTFKNPFRANNSEEIIEKINKVKYYIYFPITKINGLTFKKIGIIFINKIFKNMDTMKNEDKIIKFIINISNKKVTECHEIIAHYLVILFKANDKDIELYTPDHTFIDYTSEDENYKNSYDGGDKLESVLFGNKIIFLTIKSALYILDENNWNNICIFTFKENFKKNNDLKKDKENIYLSKQTSFVNEIINNVIFNVDQNIINVHKSNSFIIFRKNEEIKDISYKAEEDEYYSEKFSITSNAFLPKKISIPGIIKKYKSDQE